jgi:transcriptional regulator
MEKLARAKIEKTKNIIRIKSKIDIKFKIQGQIGGIKITSLKRGGRKAV